jgi:hypothetical protein
MKNPFSKVVAPQADPEAPKVDRRGVVVGAGVVGAAALAGHALLRSSVGTPTVTGAVAAAGEAAGYRLTPHVLRYYETTKA